LQDEVDVFSRRQGGNQIEALKNEAQPFETQTRALAPREPGDLSSLDLDETAGRREHSGQYRQQGRLARTRGSLD